MDPVREQDSLHTRVAVLEVTVAMLQAEFKSMHNELRALRSTLWSVGITVVGSIAMIMLAALGYFVAQKDELIVELHKRTAVESRKAQ